MKELILKETYEVVKKLVTFTILDALDDVVSEVARTVVAVEKMGIKIRWLDKVIGDICAKKYHSILIQKNQWAFCSTCEVARGDGQDEANARRSSSGNVS